MDRRIYFPCASMLIIEERKRRDASRRQHNFTPFFALVEDLTMVVVFLQRAEKGRKEKLLPLAP